MKPKLMRRFNSNHAIEDDRRRRERTMDGEVNTGR